LNAAAEMLPLVCLTGFHPPICSIRSSEGYDNCLKLEHQLNVITGFAGTTLQKPISGAQGEYALMTIRALSHYRGDDQENMFDSFITEQIQLQLRWPE
jgi:glycine dehydrogenase